MIEICAENYLCFAALLEMILKNQISKDIDINQYTIANNLGVTVPRGYKKIVNNQTFSDNEYEYGIKINEEKLKDLLLPYQISEIKNISINLLDDISFFDTVKQYLDEKYWIICGFSYGMLYGDASLNDCGHVNLILDIVGDSKILLYDPGPKNPGNKLVDEDKLYVAMRKHVGFLTLIKF